MTRLVAPPLRGRLLGDPRPLLGRHPLRPRLPAHAPQRHGGGVLALIRGQVVNLASRDLADHDGGSDYVSGSFLALRSSGHAYPSLTSHFSLGLCPFSTARR